MILERNKKPGIYYAHTDDGVELPVMDTGSVFRDGTVPRWLQSTSKIPIRIFEPGAFEKLAADAGWAVRSVKEDNPIYRVVSFEVAAYRAW